MTTNRVLVTVKNIRPKYDNLKEWMNDPNNVYIARKGIVFIHNEKLGKKTRFPEKDSKFANPFTVKEYGREKAIELYKKSIQEKIANGQITRKELDKLKGRTLGCWCKPNEDCHGDVLIEFINQNDITSIEMLFFDSEMITQWSTIPISDIPTFFNICLKLVDKENISKQQKDCFIKKMWDVGKERLKIGQLIKTKMTKHTIVKLKDEYFIDENDEKISYIEITEI